MMGGLPQFYMLLPGFGKELGLARWFLLYSICGYRGSSLYQSMFRALLWIIIENLTALDLYVVLTTKRLIQLIRFTYKSAIQNINAGISLSYASKAILIKSTSCKSITATSVVCKVVLPVTPSILATSEEWPLAHMQLCAWRLVLLFPTR